MQKVYLILFLVFPVKVFCQEGKKWTLRQAVEYAMANNITVKTASLDAKVEALKIKESKYNQLPSLNFGTRVGLQFGKSIDPTTNQFTNEPFLYQNFNLGGEVPLIGWNQLNYYSKTAMFNASAALNKIEKAANDVALNVATNYLQTLASIQQIEISSIQIRQTLIQFKNTQAKVQAGSLPELNLAEIESQLAQDSVNLINAESQYKQNLLNLKILLNLDPSTVFEIATPNIDEIPLENLVNLEPEVVYAIAHQNFPQQKMYENYIKSADYNIKAARAGMLPSLSGMYGLSTAFNNKSYERVSVNHFEKIGYFSQVDQNFQQHIAATLSIPIFNNGKANINLQRSKLNLENLLTQQHKADIDLKNDIYSAYNNATSAMQKYYAGKKTVEAAAKAYDFAQKRWDVGLLTTSDLLIAQNRLLNAKLQQLSNQIDYVFRIKLLEFYKGQGLKL